jgi:hypothetical protein
VAGPFSYFFTVDRHFDVSADGHRFLLIEQAATVDAGAAGIVVVLDWGGTLHSEAAPRG